MSNPARVLIYGRDPSLLETRQLVLETTGGVVVATTELEDTKHELVHNQPDLLVLCYTLSPDDRSAILSSVDCLVPKLKVLVLRADGPAITQTDDCDFSIFNGPAALKSKVMKMLGLTNSIEHQ